jgi:glycosyltransferase involved in cell wall biosynthesis
MRLLIVSTRQRLAEYGEFVETLKSLGEEAICVCDLDYCFLGKSKPLYIIPSPRLLGLVKQFSPDFVMTDSPYYTPYMVKTLGRRVLFHMQGAEENDLTERYWDVAMYPSFFARMYTRYLANIITPSIEKVDLILANCKWLEREVKDHFPNRQTRVLYTGIEASKWSISSNSKSDLRRPAVASLFQFTIFAKVLGLLGFMKVIKKMPDVNFYFAGGGPYFDLVKRKLLSKRLSNMFLIGNLPKSGVKNLLESADMCVHPSGMDALPRSLKEASLMEKAIVASDVGGIPEIVKNNETGYLCKIEDIDDWIEKIRFLLDHQSTARNLGKNAREFVKEAFDWRRIAKGFLNDLEALA